MILLTGGAGFVGSVLAQRLLKARKQVRIFDNLMYGGEGLLPVIGSLNLAFYQGDIRNAEQCIEALRGVDTLIHLAAIVGEKACAKNPTLARDTNFHATRQLWEIAKDNGTKNFIFASTCSNYGKAELATEKTELRPIGLYAETKVCAEEWLLSQHSDMTTVILRFATVFGISPRMRMDLLINEFVLESYLNHRLSIYNPYAQRPFCHVRDIANMICDIVETINTFKGFNKEVFNVGGYNRSKLEIANIIKRSVRCLEVDIVERGDDRAYDVDFTKIHNYGILPFRPPELQIEKMIDALPLFDDLRARKWVNA